MWLRLAVSTNLKNARKCLHTWERLTGMMERGLVQKVFPDTAEKKLNELLTKQQTLYAGFDPTADSLHVGNLLVICGLLHFQRLNQRPIALVGGATGLIGDPSGRSTERTALPEQEISKNVQSIAQQLQNIFQNHQQFLWTDKQTELPKLKIVNNLSWYEKYNILEFVSKICRHFRMGQMLSRHSVQKRIESEQGMSFTEFTYQVFQGYDWLHLVENENCIIQLGGSDQMGNIMSGHELITRVNKKEVFGITMPLITNEEGDKYGKSAGNAIWLDASKTSAFKLYQFFIRTPDDQVEKLLKLLTFIPLQEIAEIMEEHRKTPAKRKAQTVLATNVTLLVHGDLGLEQAERATKALYEGSVESLSKLNFAEINEILEGSNVVELQVETGITIFDLAMKAHCFATEQDATRIIKAGGFYMNQKRVTNVDEPISILENGLTILRVGKRNFNIIRWLNLNK